MSYTHCWQQFFFFLLVTKKPKKDFSLRTLQSKRTQPCFSFFFTMLNSAKVVNRGENAYACSLAFCFLVTAKKREKYV
jgi:hypothetical protein